MIRRISSATSAHDEFRGASFRDAEARVVFALARTSARAPHPLAIATGTDWQRVLKLASDENAIIALRDRLSGNDGSVIPAVVERYVAMLALDREYRMRLLRTRLEHALIALNNEGIDVLLLKGGALACTVYHSFRARPMRDIDLLVRPEHADAARELMLDLDWAADPDLPGDRSYGTHQHLPPLRDVTASGLRMEIHRALLPAGHPFRFRDDEIWQASRVVNLGNAHARVMAPDHHAVHVAIHFAWSHMLKMGAWHAFRDLATLVESGVLRWSELTDTALAWGAATCCYWTLRLGSALADLSVPNDVLGRLRPLLPETLRRPLARHFINGLAPSEVVCPSARLDQALWSIAMQPRRHGHGDIRPWLVSQDLLFALNEKARIKDDDVAKSTFRQMRRSSRYLSEIFA